jgi:hypothetical protein
MYFGQTCVGQHPDQMVSLSRMVSGFSLGLSVLAQSPEVFNYAFN